MLQVNNLVGFGGAQAVAYPSVNLTNGGAGSSTNNNTAYHLLDRDIGEPSDTRWMAVAMAAWKTNNNTTISIATDTQAADYWDFHQTTGDRLFAGIALFKLPTGTTVTPRVTANKNLDGISIGWLMFTSEQADPRHAVEVATDESDIISCVHGGGVIVANQVSNGQEADYTNATRTNIVDASGSNDFSSLAYAPDVSAGNRTITYNQASGTNRMIMVSLKP